MISKRSPQQYLKDKSKGLLKKIYRRYIAEEDMMLPVEQTEATDVFIIGYPKSGNTWMQALVSSLVYGIDPEFMPLALPQELVCDINSKHFYKRIGEPCFFKSHDLPQPRFQKVVYLIRDGRDAMLSYYHMYQLLGRNDSLEQMIKGDIKLFPSLWHEHILAWQKNPYEADILVIKYEDLLKDTVKELDRFCDFINIERSEEWINRVVEGNSFNKMKQKAATQKNMGHKLLKGGRANEFFRKGKKGDYKTAFPEAALQYFNEISKEALTLHKYL